MKQYFAKYLPVEGEIDFTKIGTPIWYHNAYRTLVQDGVLIHPVRGCTTRFEFYKNVNAKPAKLFLCSRDIQVGDKFHSFSGCSKLKWDGKFQLHPDDFKVIGEISPQAIWVKEGDEFDEDEVKIIDINESRTHAPYNVDQKLSLIGTILVELKGSCGHFH